MTIDRRTCEDLHKILTGLLAHFHVSPARGNQGESTLDPVAILGLTDMDGAQAVKAAGIHGREPFGHMLNDGNAGGVRRHLHKDLLDRLGSTG